METVADSYLAEWARWAGNESHLLGYPREWVTGKAAEGGINAGSIKPPVQIPMEVATTDLAVATIRHKHRSVHWHVIRIRYLERSPIEGVMRAMRVSRTQAYRVLGRAQRALYLAREAIDCWDRKV